MTVASNEIRHGAVACSAMLIGAKRLVDAVAVTLSLKGRNVIFGQLYGATNVTKDGVTIVKAIEFKIYGKCWSSKDNASGIDFE